MPPPEKTKTRLQAILKADTKNFESTVKKFLASKRDVSLLCELSLVNKLQTVFNQAITALKESQKHNDIKTVLLAVQHIATFADKKGISFLLENGLLDMIKTFTLVVHALHTSSEGIITLFQEVLETIEAVADSGPKGKGMALECFGARLIKLIFSESSGFSVRNESLKTVNMLLEQCPTDAKEKLKKCQNYGDILNDLVDSLNTAGDYEFQVGMVECLFRLTSIPARKCLAKKSFKSSQLVEGFLSIKDSEFETDCRKFLLVMNNHPNSSITTIPAKRVQLGKYELKKPEDNNYEAFWIDFNHGSSRLSWFCEPKQEHRQEADNLWETVSIWSDDVLKYEVENKGETLELVIELKSSIKQLIDVGQNLRSRTVTIHFAHGYDVKRAITKTFHKEKTILHNQKVTKKCSVVLNPVKTSFHHCHKLSSDSDSFAGKIKLQESAQQTTDNSKTKVSTATGSLNISVCNRDKTKETPKGKKQQKRIKTPLPFMPSTPNTVSTSTGIPGNKKHGCKVSVGIIDTLKKAKNSDKLALHEKEVVPSSYPDDDNNELNMDQMIKSTVSSSKKFITKSQSPPKMVQGYISGNGSTSKRTDKKEITETTQEINHVQVSEPSGFDKVYANDTVKIPLQETETRDNLGHRGLQQRHELKAIINCSVQSVDSLSNKAEKSTSRPMTEELPQVKNSRTKYVSPDSTSQPNKDISADIVEVVIPEGMVVNPKDYERRCVNAKRRISSLNRNTGSSLSSQEGVLQESEISSKSKTFSSPFTRYHFITEVPETQSCSTEPDDSRQEINSDCDKSFNVISTELMRNLADNQETNETADESLSTKTSQPSCKVQVDDDYNIQKLPNKKQHEEKLWRPDHQCGTAKNQGSHVYKDLKYLNEINKKMSQLGLSKKGLMSKASKPRFFKSRTEQSICFNNKVTVEASVYEFEPDLDVEQCTKHRKKSNKRNSMVRRDSVLKSMFKKAAQKQKSQSLSNRRKKNLITFEESNADPVQVHKMTATPKTDAENFDVIFKNTLLRTTEKSHLLRKKKRINYNEEEISDSELPIDSCVLQIIDHDECNTESTTEARVKSKQKHYKRKSIFSETDDNISARSEISWIAKSSMKRKPKVEKTYLQQKNIRHESIYKKLKYDDNALSDDAVSEMDSDIGRKHRKPKQTMKKRKIMAADLDDEDDVDDSPTKIYLDQSYFNIGKSLLVSQDKDDVNLSDTPLENELHFSIAELGKTTKAASPENEVIPLKDLSEQDNSPTERFSWQETDCLHSSAAFEMKSSWIVQETMSMDSEDLERDEDSEEQTANIPISDIPKRSYDEERTEKEGKKTPYLKEQNLLPDSPDSYISQNDKMQDRNPDTSLDSESDSVQDFEDKAVDNNIQSGMATLLQSFSSDIQMNLLARKNELENITRNIVKASQKYLNSAWLEEYNYRKRLLSDFIQAINEELQDLDKDIKLLHDTENKCLIFYKDQLSFIAKSRSSQYQRIKKLAHIEEDYSSTVASDLHAKRLQQSSREMLKKEIQNLQKNLMQKMQQQEIEKMKRCLQAVIM